MAEKTKAEQLMQQFLKTPEMQECSTFAGKINNQLDPGDTVPVTINVPKAFIRLTDFLEQKRVGGSSGKPRPAGSVLNQILLNDLHEQLHALTTGPLTFAHYRELWNSYCDANGAPEEKLRGPLDPEHTLEGPF